MGDVEASSEGVPDDACPCVEPDGAPAADGLDASPPEPEAPPFELVRPAESALTVASLTGSAEPGGRRAALFIETRKTI